MNRIFDLNEAVQRMVNHQRPTDAAFPEHCKDAIEWLEQVAAAGSVQVYRDCETGEWKTSVDK